VFPNEDPVLQEKYMNMHNQSVNLFKDYTNGKVNERQIQTRGDSKNPLKTNPLPKTKANDLKLSSFNEQTPSKNMNSTHSKFNYVKSSGYGKAIQQKQYPNPNNPYGGGLKY
jgi:hypothetical protein